MAAPHGSADTPVMRQYLDIKSRYPDAILMFRMGDFYEMFFEDAVEVAPVLDIALTSRDRDAEDPVPMAGVPYHAVGGYLRTLVERGFKVAICEQLERPEEARKRSGSKIVKRDVVRVVTPGALLDEEHLRSSEPNYLVAFVPGPDFPQSAGLSALDISSGEFIVVDLHDEATASTELVRLAPREILAPATAEAWLRAQLGSGCPRLELDDAWGRADAVRGRVQGLARESGVALEPAMLKAAALALGYAEATQPGQTLLLHRIRKHEPHRHLQLDDTSLRNLEIFGTLRDGQRRGSLLGVLDDVRTAMGGRLLRAWLGAPSRDMSVIARRQDAVEAFVSEPKVRSDLRERLKGVRDIIRLTARARLGTATPRELGAIRDSLAVLPGLVATLRELGQRRTDAAPELVGIGDDLLEDVRSELTRVLVDQPPSIARDGNIVRHGADGELDRQRALRDGGRESLVAIESRERERTGIANLKVQHNRVFGYFIEVPRAQLARVPNNYVRKQTVANAERYVTEELAKHEAEVLGAQAEALALELAQFHTLREFVSQHGERLCRCGESLATLDVVLGLAELAARAGYVRPELVDEPVLEIVDGRHPVVEQSLDRGKFVPNDARLVARGSERTHDDARLWIVTGPNMGGKSTVMRQTAIIVILAQMGSFVPARTAKIGLVDRVFTRVGAADDLSRGESTFMVEMRETAQILAQASTHSLVLLDEVGRGTATYDGIALAWAIAEHLHDQIGCRSMFATHYHELCELGSKLEHVANVHVGVHEERGRIVFLHRVESGPAGRSYGIHVGRLAGLPARVLRRAQRLLERLEASDRTGTRDQLDLFAGPASLQTLDAAPEGLDAVVEALRQLDPDALSPREAHELMRTWHARVRDVH